MKKIGGERSEQNTSKEKKAGGVQVWPFRLHFWR